MQSHKAIKPEGQTQPQSQKARFRAIELMSQRASRRDGKQIKPQSHRGMIAQSGTGKEQMEATKSKDS